MRVKNSSIFAAPRRFSWKRRGAFFGFCAVAGALLLAFSGQMIAGLSLFSDGESDRQVAPTQNISLEARRNRSLSDALSKIDGRTVQAYLKRWSEPENSALAGAPRAIFIDTEVLARRHPAWRLAEEIQRGGAAPASPRIARVLASQLLASQPVASALASGERPGSPASKARTVPQTITSGDRSNSATRNRALERFLADSAARGAKRASDEAFLSRRALDDAVALARRGAISAAEIAVLPPDVALELLNLRLELLRNISRTPAQRAASRDAIRVIEARYAAILKGQTDAQAARLRAATMEIPDRTLREGRLQIARDTQLAARQAAQKRFALGAQSRNQWRRDMETGGALQLALPAVEDRRVEGSLAPQSPRLLRADSPGARSGSQFFETAAPPNASKAQIEEGRARSGTQRAAFAAQLRELARRDAAQWAKLAATHFGARLDSSQNRSGPPDFTAQALRLLFAATPH